MPAATGCAVFECHREPRVSPAMCKPEQPDIYAASFMEIGAVDVGEITLVASPVS